MDLLLHFVGSFWSGFRLTCGLAYPCQDNSSPCPLLRGREIVQNGTGLHDFHNGVSTVLFLLRLWVEYGES